MKSVTTTSFVLAVTAVTVLALPAVIRLEDNNVENVCRGRNFSTECTTVTATGFLRWNSSSSGEVVTFHNSDTIGESGTLGNITLTLSNKEVVSGTNATIYTSIASVKIMEETGITCSDGIDSQSINITTKSPSRPSWAHSACRFSQDNVQLFWNNPSIDSECCVHYAVRLSTNENVTFSNTTSLNINVTIGDNPINATVYCIDYLGENTTSQKMSIDSSTTPEVTIDALNTSCNGNTSYSISWTTSPPSEGVCTPPITMSTITCTTSSTHQSSNNTRSMICSVPSTETLSVNVTVTNAARRTVMKSSFSDILPNACSNANGATILGLSIPFGILLAIAAAVVIALIIYLAVYCSRKRSETITEERKQ